MKKQVFHERNLKCLFPIRFFSFIISVTENRRFFPLAKKQRIGILGGSFDPVHRGHIAAALGILNADYVDRLLVIPSGRPGYKSCSASAEDRWKMLVAACSCDKRLVPSRLELDRDGTTYAVDTLLAVRKEYPDAKLFYIIGSDTLMTLHHWLRMDEVFRLCSFLVIPREEDSVICGREISRLSAMGGNFRLLPPSSVRISSSSIRAVLAGGGTPDDLNPAVLEYCRCKGLYNAPGRLDHIDEWIDKLFAALKPRRFAHSLSVAAASALLAVRFGEDPLKAEQAGLLHDCAKCLPLKEMQRIAVDNSLTEDPDVLSSDALLHSIVGACLAQQEYGMEDPDVLEAISFHNTGYPGMSRLAMCVCLADYMEPLRESFPVLEEVRALSRVSLEKALLLSLESTVNYVLARGWYLYPRTADTISWLKGLPSVQG